jgi:hypothetical protein
MSRLHTVLAAVAMTAAALVLVTTAGADNVGVSVSSITLAPGESQAVSYSISATGGSCDADVTPAVVTLSAAGPITLSTSSLTFTACDAPQSVTITANAGAVDGSYEVTPAADPAYNTSPGKLTVMVQGPDVTDPTLSLPLSLTVEATSPAGAVVTYSVSASDSGGAVTVSCNPPSGSTFPLGATTVTCTATDASANTATGSFVVTVQDTTGPVITVPSGISVEATSPAGATVSYDASATDVVDGTRPVTCSPASGSVFAPGATTVSCTSADLLAHTSSASFAVTVTNSAPTVVVPPTQTVEANGPSGSTVTFSPAPSASDTIDGPLPVSCLPASGSMFQLGTTTVTCTAVDSLGASAGASFTVSVVDTTPPTLTVPPDATFVSDSGGPLPRSSSALAAYLARGRAADAVDPQPTLYVNAPDLFPLGVTEVLYTAVDGSGNASTGTTRITVIPPPPPGQPRPTPPPDDPPPARVTNVRVVPGNGTLRLTWRPPADADVARYGVFRSERTGPQVQAYSGAAPSFTDRGLVNGVEYRYVVVAYDRAGNRSVGVAVTGVPRRQMLLRPQDRARVRAGQVFTWRAVASARYYNFQLFRVLATGGVERLQKVMSAWPVTNRFRLRATWRFEGRRYRLVAGTYRWFVWPGFGARADARYGVVLGERTFVVAARR